MRTTNCCTGNCNQGRDCPVRIASTRPAAPSTQYMDDIAVDKFAVAMKAKLAASRAKGRGGWENPDKRSVDDLRTMLALHIENGDPLDVGSFAMMLWIRSSNTATGTEDA